MNKKIYFVMISFLLCASNSFAQVIQSGKIVNGFIKCIVFDSTDHALAEAEMIKSAFSAKTKETIYFNENYIINVKNNDATYTLMDYEDRKTGLIYTVYSDSKQNIYAIDSNIIWYLEWPGMKESIDSVKMKVEEIYSSTNTIDINGFTCYVLTSPGIQRNQEGYQKFYLTRDLGLKIPGDSPMRTTEGYPVRHEIAAAPGVEVVFGILEWEKLPPDHPFFRLDLDKYKLVTMDELTEIMQSLGDN